MAAHEIRLCPVCGERLAEQEKTNLAGDTVARRACSVTKDYSEPWQHRPVTVSGALGTHPAGPLPTAAGDPRQAPIGVHDARVI